jgi:hypothetical protein
MIHWMILILKIQIIILIQVSIPNKNEKTGKIIPVL